MLFASSRPNLTLIITTSSSQYAFPPIPPIFLNPPKSAMAASIGSRCSDGFNPFARTNPKIEIELLGQMEGRVKAYTTGDKIEGVVKITVDHDTRFDEVEIALQGELLPISSMLDNAGLQT